MLVSSKLKGTGGGVRLREGTPTMEGAEARTVGSLTGRGTVLLKAQLGTSGSL